GFGTNSSRGCEPTDGHTTIDHEHLSKDITCLGRAQPNRRSGNFARLAAALGRDGPLNVFGEARILSAVGDYHWSLSPSRSQRVNAYVKRGVFHGRDSRQAVDAALGGGVGAHPARTRNCGNGSGVANGGAS